jgi:hypothetical protein
LAAEDSRIRVGAVLLALVAWCCSGFATLAALVWGRPVVGAVAVAVGLAGMYELANLFSSDWLDHLDRRSGGELLLVVGGSSLRSPPSC